MRPKEETPPFPVPDASLEPRFRAALDAHGGVLWRIAGAYARTRPDREDLYQEMLLQVWRALPSFRGEAAERTWLTRIAFNVALGAARRADVRRTVDAPTAIDAAAGEARPDLDAERGDAAARLHAALAGLAEVDRALVLMTLDARSHAEMADVLGLSVSNVGVRLHRAKKALAARLSDPLPS